MSRHQTGAKRSGESVASSSAVLRTARLILSLAITTLVLRATAAATVLLDTFHDSGQPAVLVASNASLAGS